MRIVLQRVTKAQLFHNQEKRGAIDTGLVLLLGFGREDTPDLPQRPIWGKLLDKIVGLRIFPDHTGRSDQSLTDIQGSLMVISQFTLYADWHKGRRPSFTPAARPELARDLFDRFVLDVSQRAPGTVVTGLFGREMEIELCNWGPVTLTLDSHEGRTSHVSN